MNEVVEFILRRFPNDSNWLSGNCYYFAVILYTRFPGSEIYYDSIDGHFIVKYQNEFYDWHGIYRPQNTNALIKWTDYEEIDPTHFGRIVRDTIY